MVFGERILVNVASARSTGRAALGPTMVPAVNVGHHGRSDALLAFTEFLVRKQGASAASCRRALTCFGAGESVRVDRWHLNCSRLAEGTVQPLVVGAEKVGCATGMVCHVRDDFKMCASTKVLQHK